MEYTESVDQAAEYAKSAFQIMHQQGIVPNPYNFTVWFNYHAGHLPDLKKALDILLDNGQEFDEQRNRDIYNNFFDTKTDNAAVEFAASRADKELANILSFLGLAGNGAQTYGKALEAFSGEISGDGESASIKKAIGNALSATRDMEKQNKSLEAKINISTGEIDRLRIDLESMRQEAMTDGLTGIANRKLFDNELRRMAMLAMETGEPLSLLILDIDYFKKFNDTYGHQVGDQVLKLLAQTLTASIKGQDLAARYGGEEFCVILPCTLLADAIKVAEIIRNRVGKKQVTNRKTGQVMGQITISIGVGGFKFGEPLSQLIQRSDEALYSAKHGGRDRVVSEATVGKRELSFDN